MTDEERLRALQAELRGVLAQLATPVPSAEEVRLGRELASADADLTELGDEARALHAERERLEREAQPLRERRAQKR